MIGTSCPADNKIWLFNKKYLNVCGNTCARFRLNLGLIHYGRQAQVVPQTIRSGYPIKIIWMSAGTLAPVPLKLFQSSVSDSGIYQQFQALEKFDSRLVQEWGVELCVGFLCRAYRRHFKIGLIHYGRQAQVVPQTIRSGYPIKIIWMSAGTLAPDSA